jgi:hypothetical protein
MITALAAAALALHGLIHLIGFVVPWGLAQVGGFPYRTTAFAGAIALGDAGARAVGVAWLVLAIGFVVAAVALWRRKPWAVPLAVVLVIGSVFVCAAGLPEAGIGILVDAAILAIVVASVVVARRGAGVHSSADGSPASVRRGEAA